MTVIDAGYELYRLNIAASGLSIYDPISPSDPDLWIPTPVLEYLLNRYLVGVSLAALPIRTRSKVFKEHVCGALGYPTPATFSKTHPRFPGQNFDTYVQKANNLQIWNEAVSLLRRYVLVQISSDNVVRRVKVVTGETIAALNGTGALTQKHQARLVPGLESTELVSPRDTTNIESLLAQVSAGDLARRDPCSLPLPGAVAPIATVYEQLRSLVGQRFHYVGSDQERNRGGTLQRLVCSALGFEQYRDAGQLPDVLSQLLEVKLQTAHTIDLGLVRPDSQEPLNLPPIGHVVVRHCDVRYALFYGQLDQESVTLTNLYLTTGEAFFRRFPQFQGKVINRKLQIRLPTGFFER